MEEFLILNSNHSLSADRTAAKKASPAMGKLSPRITWVRVVPSSGSPEDNSKMLPTPAIAAMQDRAKKSPLSGVMAIGLRG